MTAIIKEEPSLQDILNVYQCGGSLIHPSVSQIHNKDEGSHFNKMAIQIGCSNCSTLRLW